VSFDLVLWRGSPNEAPNETYARLVDGERIAELVPFSFEEVRKAFSAACRGDLVTRGDVILGRGFELSCPDGALSLFIICDLAFAGNVEAQRALRDAARRLDATVFDPQAAERSNAPPTPVAISLAEWGSAQPWQGTVTGASSLRDVLLSTVPPDSGPSLDQVHALYLHHIGEGIARGHSAHRSKLTNLECRYAWIPAGVMPFDIVVAYASGNMSDGTVVTRPNRLLGIVDGQIGALTCPVNTRSKEDGKHVSTWTAIKLEPIGDGRDRRGVELDLTARVSTAARAALAEAQRGETLALRTWLCVFASIDALGRAAVELPDRPIEVYEAGAAMPLWIQHVYEPGIANTSVQLPDRGGFKVRIEATQDKATPRTDLPLPLGAAG